MQGEGLQPTAADLAHPAPWPSVPIEVRRRPDCADMALPVPATPKSAGVDLCAAIDQPITLEPGTVQAIPTGLFVAIPNGFEGQVRPRSGLALEAGLTVPNAPGTIDADYRGEIGVLLIVLGNQPFTIERGMRIAQLVIAPCVHPRWIERDALSDTERGSGGFGSTGHLGDAQS